MVVDTRRIANRRSVHYSNLDEFLADAEHLAATEVHALGNWTLPQIFDHLTRSLTVAVDGTTASFSVPARFVLRFFKKRVISRPMKPGFHCPESVEQVLRPGAGIDTDLALGRLRTAIARFQSATQVARHPAFGKLTKAEWNQLTLRHAELHMSFIVSDVPGVQDADKFQAVALN